MLSVPGIRMVIYWYMMYCDMWCIDVSSFWLIEFWSMFGYLS